MDTSKPSHALGITRYQLYCTLAASLGSFNFGWVMSATNLPGDIISKCTSIVESHSDKLINGLPVCLPIGDTLWGLVVGSFALGALIGAIACTRFSNMYGRRTVLLYSNVISIIGALLGAFALNPAMLAASRVLAGIGTGAANGTFTTYVVEITTPRARSSLGSMTQMAIILGILAVQLCSLGTLQPPLWRFLFGLTGVISVLNILALWFCVESPRWLLMQGHSSESLLALQKLRRNSDCSEEFDHMAQNTTSKTSTTISTGCKQSNNAASAWDVLWGKTPDNLRHQLLVSVMAMVFQQASGISAVSFYSTKLFDTVVPSNRPFNGQPTMAQILTAVLSLAGSLVTLVGMALATRWRRRTLMLLSHILMAVCSVFISLGSIRHWDTLAVCMVFIYWSAFFLGSGPIPWVSPSEMTPTYAVAAIGAISGSINYLCIFAIGIAFPPILQALEGYTFLLFAGANFIAAVFFFFLLPETKDLRVSDVVRVHSVGIHNVLLAKYNMSEYTTETTADDVS